MTQTDILDLLKKDPDKWFTILELSQILNVTNNSINKNLLKLRKYNLVDSKQEKHSKTQTATWQHKFKGNN